MGGSKTSCDADLSPETLLQLAPGVRTRFDATEHVLLDAPDGTTVDLGPRRGEAIDRNLDE